MGLGARKPTNNTTTVVNVRAHPRDFDVWVGKAGLGFSGEFGSPFRVGRDCRDKREAMDLFRKYFYDRIGKDDNYRAKILALKGMRLGCVCRVSEHCHASVIAAWLNAVR